MNLNKLWFHWKPVDVQLGTISENARIGDCYQCAKFHACIKKCTIYLIFRAMPPAYHNHSPLLTMVFRITEVYVKFAIFVC